MTKTVLDTSVLDAMFGDDDSIKQAILDEFKNCAGSIIADMDSALTAKSNDGVRAVAHKLKSSSRTIGAVHLGDICESLELLAKTASFEEVQVLSEQLREEMAAVITAIDAA